MRDEKKMFQKWIESMSHRWRNSDGNGRTIQREFGPFKVRLDQQGVTVQNSPFDGSVEVKWWSRFEDLRIFVVETVRQAERDRVKHHLDLGITDPLVAELKNDVAEGELSS